MIEQLLAWFWSCCPLLPRNGSPRIAASPLTGPLLPGLPLVADTRNGMAESPAHRLLPAVASLPVAAACLPWLVSLMGACDHRPSECIAAAPVWPGNSSASVAPPVGGCSLRGL